MAAWDRVSKKAGFFSNGSIVKTAFPLARHPVTVAYLLPSAGKEILKAEELLLELPVGRYEVHASKVSRQ